jgi:hypothetical protein
MAQRRSSRRIFSYDEALSTFPAVRDLTAAAVRKVEALADGLAGGEEVEARRGKLEEARERIVRAWTREITASPSTSGG